MVSLKREKPHLNLAIQKSSLVKLTTGSSRWLDFGTVSAFQAKASFKPTATWRLKGMPQKPTQHENRHLFLNGS